MFKFLKRKNPGFSNIFSNEGYLLFCGFILILIYFLPYLILGRDSSILIHDNLDSTIAWIKILLDSGNLFASPLTKIKQVFNGIPYSSLLSSYDISLIGFKLFGIYWGYVFNKLLIAIVALFGMYYLLKIHFLSKEQFLIIPFGVALIFSFLPFSGITITVAGLPLILFAFLNLRKKNLHFINWFIILIFPFYSGLSLSGIFFMIIILIIIIYDAIKSKTVNFLLLFGLILLGIFYIISHFPLFYTLVIDSGVVSHRLEFKNLGLSMPGVINEVSGIFKFGQYHAQSLHYYILIPILIGTYLIFNEEKINKKYVFILLFIIITSIIYGVLQWRRIQPLVDLFVSIIPLQLQRFHWLHPMFWYILFGVSLSMILKDFRFGKQIVVFILILQFLYVIQNHELISNRYSPSFQEFFAEEQFKEIESYIGKPKENYRVVSLGMHPSIAQFNGFYTLDGYFGNYPLKYKHEFRLIIANELEKDSSIKDYFDNWGSRCYLFSSELGNNFTCFKYEGISIDKIDINNIILKKLGGEYIISAVKINNEVQSKIILEKVFENSQSAWNIYLYKVL